MSDKSDVTSDIKIEQPVRIFRMGSLELNDPAPDSPPEDAIKIHAVNFPQLAAGILGSPVMEDDKLVYAIEKPPVKTNGIEHDYA